MATAARMLLLAGIFGFIMTFQMNTESDVRATTQLKHLLEIAVHDAALAIQDVDLSRLEVIINQEEAEDRLIASLEKHIGAERVSNSVLQPHDNSFFQEHITIKELIFVDDSLTYNICSNQSAPSVVSYPCLYESNEYNFSQQLQGPAVIAILETESPRFFRGDPITITQGAVYEYRLR